jgi:hypothetical protein
MAKFWYCFIKVFGSDFNAIEFANTINIPGAEVTHKAKAYPSSPLKALQAGNISTWTTPKEYYEANSTFSTPFSDYIYEEEFMVSYIKKYSFLPELLYPYMNETTEIFFVAVYKGEIEEKPAGVYFGHELIEALHEITASISTEIVLN